MKRLYVALILGVISASASAAPIYLSFEADVSGTLDSQVFDSHVRFDFVSDTLAADTFSNEFTDGYRLLVFQNALTVTIDGFGSGTILTPLFLISNPNPYCECIGILKSEGSQDVFAMAQTEFDLSNPYDFTTSAGPVGAQELWLNGSSAAIETELGTLIMYGFRGVSGNSMFTASVVPVPASIWLLTSALGLLGWAGRGAGIHCRQT